MIQDLFAWLLATFVIGPVQDEIASKLQAAQVPAAIMQQAQACVVAGTPKLVERATSDPWWGVRTTIGVAVGMTNPLSIIAEALPDCAAAMVAVQPFWKDVES